MIIREKSNPALIITVITASFLLGAVLNVYPISSGLAECRPMILMTLVIFWSMYKPSYVGIIVTCLVGFFADLLFNNLLGQQAFCALLATFFGRLGGQYVKQFTFISAWILAIFCLFIFQFSFFVLQFMMEQPLKIEMAWSLLSSIFLWPVLMVIFQKFR